VRYSRRLVQGLHVERRDDPEPTERSTHGGRHVGWRQMRVMTFGHAGIRVAELSGNHGHRHAAHCQA
jgi:hypothetical protein